MRRGVALPVWLDLVESLVDEEALRKTRADSQSSFQGIFWLLVKRDTQDANRTHRVRCCDVVAPLAVFA